MKTRRRICRVCRGPFETTTERTTCSEHCYGMLQRRHNRRRANVRAPRATAADPLEPIAAIVPRVLAPLLCADPACAEPRPADDTHCPEHRAELEQLYADVPHEVVR